jgi:FMN phosphatase YigB (HAD superfamily)
MLDTWFPKIILFDIDGVVIRPPKYFSYRLEERGFKDSVKILNEYYKGEANILCLTGKANPVNSIKPFLDRIEWKHSPEDFFLQQYEYESKYIDQILIRKISDSKLKNVVCIMTTDQDSLRSSFLLDDLKFRDIFDDYCISCEIGYRKKEETFWQHVLGKIISKYPHVNANEILFCDDLKSNVEVAFKTGIKVLQVKHSRDIKTLYDILDNNRFSI